MNHPIRTGSSARTAGFTLCSAMIAALLSGCAGGPSTMASVGHARVAGATAEEAVSDGALAKVEARVAKAPQDVAARAALAQGYLAAGRFTSAATTFEDAVALGDRSPRTGLSLALAYIGSGRSAEALDVLARWRDQLPAGDYGLAVALAGQPTHGVAILSEVVKRGENTAKARQNLAYAYALDGRWLEARVIASQDLAGEELDTRLREWASRTRPEMGSARVAGLLGTPLRMDPGQPAALALGGIDHTPRFAAAEPVAAEPVAEELPAVAEQVPVLAEAAPASPAFVAPVVEEKRSSIERAFAGSLAKAQKPAAKAERGTHLVQLGSFRTLEGAKRAWGIFQKRNPALRGHAMQIIEAEVRGQRYYRVAAEGFGRGAAQSMCSTVRKSGQECLAYAEGDSLPGALSARGSRLASR